MMFPAELIFWPMILIAVATMLIYIPMSRARVKSVLSGKVKASVYKLNNGEPEESLRFNNAISNQFESPVLFYAVCLAAFVSGNANSIMIILAFLYAILKLFHIYIHISTNNLRRRRPVFALSLLVLLIMWLAFAIQLLIS